MNKLIWIEIKRKALEHNVRVLRRLVGPDTVLAPTVKSNAYGHGLALTAKILLQSGADWLAVNSLDEAVILRQAGVRKPILVIGYIPRAELPGVLKFRLRVFVYSRESVLELSRLAELSGRKARVHIKVDTGMGRQGILAKDLPAFAEMIRSLPGLVLEGLATHYASSDEPDRPQYFQRQKEVFFAAREALSAAGISFPYWHSANSAAVLQYGYQLGNLVRPGKSLYGNYPSSGIERSGRARGIVLKPALSLKTRVAMVKEVPAGSGISYGSTYIAKRRIKIVVLPIGYYDGYDRRLSARGEVLLKGRRCPILGRICMNMCLVDVSHLPRVKAEDEAVLIGRQGREKIRVEELAEKIGTINYEVLSRLRESIERRVV